LSARGGRGSGSGGGSSRPSTSAADYSNVAAAPKNFLIHVYKLHDELSPFLKEGDFNNIRDIIMAAIWASYAEPGVDRNLSVNNWVYKRLRHEMGIGLIFCASEACQRRFICLILDNGLSSHIVETAADVSGGMKISFKQPIFGPQRIDLLLAAIWELNDLTGECGTREMRVDRPKDGNPYMVWTVHFPVNVVEYAEQRNFRLAGPDGSIFLYGNDVTAGHRANFEAAEARRCEEEERRKAQPQPPPLQHPQVMPTPAPASAALWRMLVESIAASKTYTICSESLPAAVAGEEAQMMVPYPHALVAVADLMPEYPDRPDLIPVAEFATYSRSKRQRSIRRYKKYAECLRGAHRVSDNADPDHPEVASDEEDE
jgi:hypothetical protein